MTLEEKIGQMTLYTSGWATTGAKMDDNYMDYIKTGKCGAIFNALTAEYTKKLQKVAVESSRLKIPLIFGYDVIHGHRTIMPIPLAEACSWDMAAIEKSCRIAAIEASAEGINWTFAPMVDIARDPRWGRVAEGSGEDTYLGCLIAKARVKGFQGDDLSKPDTIIACAKHYAAYGGAQGGRDYNSVDVSERTLFETYLPPFKACVEAGVGSFMTAFNDLSGVPCTANKFLLTKVLHDLWGFNGFVVTDYTSINELVPHGIAANEEEAGKLSVLAGVDMDMEGGVYMKYLAKQVKDGIVPMNRIDEAVKRILIAKWKLGLFEDPYRYCDENRQREMVLNPKHLAFSLEMAKKSMVLLQNEKNILPLRKDIKKIAVIGPLASSTEDLLGSWHAAGDGKKPVSVLDSIKEIVNPGVEVLYAQGCDITESSHSGFQKAIETAKEADVIILTIGERESMSGEASSRSDIDLPGVQNDLVEAIATVKKPTVAVLFNGRPLTITKLTKKVDAILEAWFPGTMGGKAVAEVVFGDYNPSGKLTISFPRSVGQIPIYYNMKNTGRPIDPKNKYTSKYIDIPNTPLYPFGWGLSYTTFKYSGLTLSSKTIGEKDVLKISVDVKNEGKMGGEETVQLYVRNIAGSVTRPVKELKGYKKVQLNPSETKKVEFELNSNDLAFYRFDMSWGPEAGNFEVFVGGNSQETLNGKFELKMASAQ
ncbi:MAG: beta-glucosidase BglX [Candidatus Riflebacteria bacterium]|nr:beta-glucosidase BglX [Candidatus Riflebacteria bacterium]